MLHCSRIARGHLPWLGGLGDKTPGRLARSLARSFLGGLGRDIASQRATSYMATQNAKDARLDARAILGGIGGLAIVFQSQLEYMGGYAHIFIYTLFLA
jgi:hypothetical protein